MLIRIVRMFFKEENVKDYFQILDETKEQIRNFDGCLKLEILQDLNQEHIITFYSYWRDKKALDNYRHSGFFMENWRKTKKLFSEKPMAFSCILLDEVAGIGSDKKLPSENN